MGVPDDADLGAGGSGAGGGGGGAGAGGNDGGLDSVDGGDGDADAGNGEEGDASPDGADEYPPGDVACEMNVAFLSRSLSFIDPTAPGLGRVLGPFLANPRSHSFVLALRGSKGADADGAASAATAQDGIYSFPVGSQKPTLVSVSLAQGRFQSEVQTSGFLTFQDEETSNHKTLHLTNIQFSSFTKNDCQEVVAIVNATLPAEPQQAGMQIVSEGKPHTLADLAGMKEGPDKFVNVPISFVLVGEATSFEFSSL